MNDPSLAQVATLPYPGLRPFHIHEVEIFFGREEQTDQLLNRLQKTRFLAIVGPSGCGKSSLVRAGMIAALQTGLMARAGSHWRIAQMRPGERPLRRLAAALAEPAALDLERSGGPTALAFADATLRRGPLGLEELLQERWLPEGANLLLLVDQFEEIFRFRQEVNADEADAFVALLLATATRATFPVYVVLTMRSDFLGECALFQGLPEAINDGQYLTPRMTREQIRSAIVGPARVFDADVEPALVTSLLNEVGADPDQLPLLQHALMRMWQEMLTRTHAKEDPAAPVSIITMADYHQVGSIAAALTVHASQVYDNLTPAQQRIAEVMFRRLTHRASGKRDTRRPARLGDVANVAGVPPEEVIAVVEEFRRADRSFVTPPVGVPLAPDTILDIGHESLIRQWDRLNDWVDKEAKSAAMYLRLVDAARRESEGKAPLWRSAELQEGLVWRENENPNPHWATRYGVGNEFNDYARALNFLDRSLEQEQAEIEERERSRREREELERERQAERQLRLEEQARAGKKFRWLSLAMAILALLAGGAAFQAWRSEKEALDQKMRADAQADLALARQLNAEAQAKLSGDAESAESVVLGLLLTLASLDSAWTAEGYEILISHMDLLPPRPQKTWKSSLGPVLSLAVSPDGRWIAVGGRSGAEVHAADGKAEPRRLEIQPREQRALAFSPDSQRLAAGCGREVCLFETATWAVAQRLDPGPGSGTVRSLSFNQDGSLVASARFGSRITKIHETRGWTERASIATEATLSPIVLDPKGQWVAAAGPNAVALWRLAGKQEKLAEVPQHSAWLLALSPDGTRLAIGGQGGAVQLVEIAQDATGKPLLKTGDSARTLKVSSTGPIANGAFSHDGRYLAVPDGDSVRVGDVAQGREIARLHPKASVAAFGANGRLVVGDQSGALAEWEVTQLADKAVGKLKHDGPVQAVAFSADGGRLATASGRQLRIFAADRDEAWKNVHTTGQDFEAFALKFSADGRWLVTRGKNVLQLYATSNWQPLGLMKHDGPIARVALSPDGKWFSTQTAPMSPRERHTGIFRQRKTWVWDAATGAEVGWMVAKEEGGQQFAPPTETPEPTAGGDTTLVPQAASWQTLYDFDTGEEPPNRRWLTAVTAQGTKLSDASERRAKKAHAELKDVAFSGDGRWLASAGADSSVQLWHLMPEDLKKDACARLPRNLTCAEWRASLGDRAYRKTCVEHPDPPDIGACSAPATAQAR